MANDWAYPWESFLIQDTGNFRALTRALVRLPFSPHPQTPCCWLQKVCRFHKHQLGFLSSCRCEMVWWHVTQTQSSCPKVLSLGTFSIWRTSGEEMDRKTTWGALSGCLPLETTVGSVQWLALPYFSSKLFFLDIKVLSLEVSGADRNARLGKIKLYF